MSKWISVEDRKPTGDNCDGVLAIVTGKYENVTLDHAIVIAEYDEFGGWWVPEYAGWDYPGITHWMPLPAPPEEEST